MSGALAEIQMILSLYGEDDVAFFDDDDYCPECSEVLNSAGYCPNGCGCVDDDDEDTGDFRTDLDDFDDDLEDVRPGVDFFEDEDEEDGWIR